MADAPKQRRKVNFTIKTSEKDRLRKRALSAAERVEQARNASAAASAAAQIGHAICEACATADIHALETLILGRVPVAQAEIDFYETIRQGSNPLLNCCRRGFYAGVQMILQNYVPDLEVATEDGQTCLHLAAKNKSENIVGLIIEHALMRRVSIRLAKLKDLGGNTAIALCKKLAPIKDKHGKKKMAGAARGCINRIAAATKREASLNAVRKQLDKILNRVASHVPGRTDADGVPKLLPIVGGNGRRALHYCPSTFLMQNTFVRGTLFSDRARLHCTA